MMDVRIGQLARALLGRTWAGKLTWARTGDENTFLTSVPGYSLLISRYQVEDEVSEYPHYEYSLAINDITNVQVETITPGDILGSDRSEGRLNKLSGYELLSELFQVARRQALGVDEAIDRVLSALQADAPDIDASLREDTNTQDASDQ